MTASVRTRRRLPPTGRVGWYSADEEIPADGSTVAALVPAEEDRSFGKGTVPKTSGDCWESSDSAIKVVRPAI